MLAYNQQQGHEKTVTSIKLGKDRQSYYSASSDGSVLKWSLTNPKAIPEVVFESDEIVRSIDVSADGRWLMVFFYREGVELVSLEQQLGNDIFSVRYPEPVQTAIFMPKEQQYLSVTKSGELLIKGFQTQTKAVGTASSQVLSLEVNKADGTIYAGTLDGVLQGWEQQSYFGYDLGLRPSIAWISVLMGNCLPSAGIVEM